MKIKLLFVYLFLGTFLFQANAQTLNQNAAWPNTNWTVTGTYNTAPLAFEADPTLTTNFAFDDDDAGSGSDDQIAAESPVIDLTAASTAGETWITVSGNYVYNFNTSDVLQFEYWDADNSSWNIIGVPFTADTTPIANNDFCAGTSSTYTTDVLNVAGFTPTQLSGFRYRIFWDDSLSGAAWQWGFCFDAPTITSATPPSCPDPSVLTVTAVTDTTADLAWTENGSATAWDVEIVTTGTAPSGTPTSTGVSNPYTAMMLTADTQYDYYVRSNCGTDGTSTWIGPLTFRTACAPISAPYTEDFETFTTSTAAFASGNCWIGTGGAFFWESAPGTDTGSGSTGPSPTITTGNYFYTEASGGATGDTTDLVSPLVDLTALTAPALSFNYHMFGGQIGTLDVLVNGTTNVWTLSGEQQASDTTPFELAIIDLAAFAGQTISITFRATSAGTFEGDIAIDNVTFGELPSCLDVTGVTIDSITANSITASWSENNTPAETAWEVIAVATGSPAPAAGMTNATTNPYTITMLAPQTTYDVYVRTNCGTVFVGPVTATTACVTEIAPYTENFDNGGTIPACWNQGAGNSEDWLFADGSGSQPGHGGNNGAIVDHTSGTGYFAWVDDSSPHNTGTTLESPFVDVSTLTNPALSFWINSDREDSTNVDFSVDFWDGAAWNTAVYTSNSNTGGWTQGVVDLSTFTITGPVQARFVVDENNGADFDDDIALDDVSFDEAPSCFAPVNVSVTATTVDGATINFTNSNTSTNTNFEYGAPGFAQGTGTTLAQTTIPFTVTGLMSATTYDFYLQSDCGMGDVTAWVGPFSFTTDCLAIADFNENFDGVSTPDLPVCWSAIVIENATGTDPAVTTSTAADNSAPNGARLYNGSGDLTTPNDVFLISPVLSNLQAQTHRLKFFADGSPAGDVEVGTITDPSNPATFTLLQTVAITTTHTEYIINFDTYAGTDAYIAFRHPNTTTFDSIYLDDIVWEAIPSCVAPTDLALVIATDTQVTIGWTNNAGAAASSVIYGASGFDPLVAGTTVAGTGDMAMITGLMPDTNYDFYVAQDCSATGDGLSILVGPLSVTTACTALVAPYTEDFENAGATPNCWSLGGDEDWLFNLSGPNQVGNGGTLTGATASGNYYAVVDDSTPDASNAQMDSPFVDLTGLTTPELSFYLISDNSSDTRAVPVNATLTVSVWDGAAWNVAGTYNTDTVGWELRTIDLSAFTFTGPAQARFSVADSGSFYDDIAIDDVTFAEAPVCNDVTAVTIDSVTSDTVTVSWTENSVPASTAWEVVAVPTGDPAPAVGASNATTNPYTVMALAPETTYDVYVRADCSTTFVGPLSATTACAPVAAPYTEDFETFTTAGSAFGSENCWTGTGGTYYWESAPGTDNGSPNTGPDPSVTTGNYFYTEASAGTAGDTTDLVSPLVDLTALAAPSLSFNYHMFGAQIGTLDVLVNGTTNVLTLSGEQQASATAPWELAVVDLTAFAGQTISITFRGTSVGIFEGDISIDNVVFDELPACSSPNALTATNIDGFSADLGWTENGTATVWNVELVDVTAMGTATGTATNTAVGNPFNVTGLTPQNDYEFYVQADCGVDGTSIWIGPFAFTTTVACGEVTSVTFFNTDSVSTDLSWVSSDGSPASYNVEVVPFGNAQGVGVIVGGNIPEPGNATATPNALMPDTQYDVWIQTDCGGLGTSAYAGPFTFRTACLPTAAPYTEDFETFTTSASAFNAENCWTGTGGSYFWESAPGTDTGSGGTGPDPSITTGNYFYTEASAGAIGDTTDLVSPLVDLSTLTAPSLSFNYHMFGAQIGTLDVLVNGTTSVWSLSGQQQTSATTPWEFAVVDLAAFAGQTISITFRATSAGTFEGDIALDNVVFDELPGCIDVTGVTLDSTTADSVTVSWTENNTPPAMAWEVVAVPAGDPAPAVGTTNATAIPYTIMGLTSGTQYDVYVRADCSTAFTGPISATTNALCGDNVFDTGGAAGNYSDNESYTVTYLPDAPGNVVTLDFTLVDLENCCDTLEVFDGLDVTATAFTADLESPASFRATNPDGAITIRFTSDGSVTAAGWAASYTCAAAPTCLEPTALTATNITITTADLSWTTGGSGETAWDVEVLLAGAIPTGIPTDAGVANPFTATGLSSGTDYQYWVRAACGPGDVSIWSGPFVFTTVAGCGDTVYDTGGATGNYSDNESYTVTYLPDTMANVVTLDFISVVLENCCDTLEVFDGLDVTASVLEADLESPASFTATNTDGAITIRFTSDGSVTDAGWEANYICTPRPTCVDVSAVTIDSVTSDSVTISWTENNIPAGTAWEVIAVPTGDPAPAVGTSNATTNPFTIPALMANTSYDIYVRTDCSTTFAAAITATTNCDINSVYPYVTDFTNNVPNACWDEAGDGAIATGPSGLGASEWRAGRSYEDFAGNVTPSNAMNLYRNSDREWLLSEQYDMTGTSNDVLSIEVAVTAWISTGASDATNTATMGPDDQVDLLITTDGGTTWTSLMTWNVANQPAVDGTREDIDLSSYTGTVQFAFFASDGTVDNFEDYDFHVGMFIIDGTAGNEDTLDYNLSLYPNPVDGDTVTITMSNLNTAAVDIAIYNTLGQQVMTRTFNQVNNSITIDNLSSLSNGMYMVRVTNGTQQKTLKFIKE